MADRHFEKRSTYDHRGRKMKDNRQQKILELLKQEQYLSVNELSQRLFFSKPTVRRDLAELEKSGLIFRSHGGASLKSTPNSDVAFDLRNTLHTRQKAEIARKAAAMIEDGDVVFLDASTTALHMAKYLSDKHYITIITNSIQLPALLRGSNIPIYSTGGRLIPNSLAFGGPVAEQSIKHFHIDKLFFSSCALSTDGEILDFSEEETRLRQVLMEHADKTIFLCDSSKLGKSAVFHVAYLSQIDAVISDTDIKIADS